MMDRFGSFWVRYQRVIALPKTLWQLMNLQFDFDASVEFLDHVSSLPSARSTTTVFRKVQPTVYFSDSHFTLPILA